MLAEREKRMNKGFERFLAAVAVLLLATGVLVYVSHKRAAENRAKCLENLKVLAMAASGYNQGGIPGTPYLFTDLYLGSLAFSAGLLSAQDGK